MKSIITGFIIKSIAATAVAAEWGGHPNTATAVAAELGGHPKTAAAVAAELGGHPKTAAAGQGDEPLFH
jgi:hypothetical protein